ncbi:MAG: hypothetical protein ACI8RO_000840, partial [Flavobacteriales bacterium]
VKLCEKIKNAYRLEMNMAIRFYELNEFDSARLYCRTAKRNSSGQ